MTKTATVMPDEKPELHLSNKDGNAFAILASARRVALANNMPWERIEREAKAGSYDNLIQVMMKYFEVI